MTIQLPAALQFLFKPNRYKIAYGGRGAAKSWGYAIALLVMGTQRKMRILCAREIQNSIKESVHNLLRQLIAEMGLSSFYLIKEASIVGLNGTEFIFSGLLRNVDSIKSMEGIDVVWVEEARNVSQASWELLIPTIRKDESEIWITFNPLMPDDYTYSRFVLNPPNGAEVHKLNWHDNPWFPPVLRLEMEDLRHRDYQSYRNVWLGECFESPIGALWKYEDIQRNRYNTIPSDDVIRIVVAIDPAVSTAETSADTGIVVAYLMRNSHVLIVEDLTCHAAPLHWAKVAITAYYRHRADLVAGENNQGGDLVESNIRALDPNIPFRAVRAKRGKSIRAQPVASLYAQGRIHHVGQFTELERQMIRFVPGEEESGLRLDRMDALVWAVTELLLDEEKIPQIRPMAFPVRISRY